MNGYERNEQNQLFRGAIHGDSAISGGRPNKIATLHSGVRNDNKVALYKPNDNIVKQSIRRIDEVVAEGRVLIRKFEKTYPISYKIVGSGVILAGGAGEAMVGLYMPFAYGAGKIIEYTYGEQLNKALDRYVVNKVLKLADIRPGDPEYATSKLLLKGSIVASIGGVYSGKMLRMQKNMLPSATPLKPTSITYGEGFTKIHKNSHNYIGDTHVYRILDKDGTYKIGESARGVRKSDGKSIRAEQQARKLRYETGEKFETEIRRTFPSKKEAYEYENNLIKKFRETQGQDSLPGNKGNH